MKFKLNQAVYDDIIVTFQVRDKIHLQEYLVNCLKLKGSDKVLDLGCGYGNSLVYILQQLTKQGHATGLDINEDYLAVAEKVLDKKIRKDKLTLELRDVSKKLPYEDNSFDKIICHNVLECIEDKIGFINESYRILKKGGIFVLSHCDFDTQLFNSLYPELSRKLLHNYADTKQEWMATVDGMIGRKLFGLMSHSKFENINSEVYIVSNTSYEPYEYGFRIAEDIANIAIRSGLFTESEVKIWLEDLEQKHKQKEYFYSSNINIMIAYK